MSEQAPRYIATETRGGTHAVWRRCGDGSCESYHGPICESKVRWDAERIARALTRYDLAPVGPSSDGISTAPTPKRDARRVFDVYVGPADPQED